MGQGLGKNSPVVLTLGRANYEALIDRHGQWVRWRRSQKCPCVSYPSMQPDIHCQLCGGRGELYGIQDKVTSVVTAGALDMSGMIELPEEYEGQELVKVYDGDGREYPHAVKLGRYVDLHEAPPEKGTYYSLVLTGSTQKHVDTADTVALGGGFYRVKGIQSVKTGIEGIYYPGTPDLVAIGRIVDGNGMEYEPLELRLDTFLIEPKVVQEQDDAGRMVDVAQPIVEPVTVMDVSYMPPFTFAILSQNLSQADGKAVADAQGDAVCTFPYACDVAEGDVMTVLSGTVTDKAVQAKTDGDFDTLPAFFVAEIVSIVGLDENKASVEYINGVDYQLSGSNRIRWLGDRQPLPGDAYSVVYRSYPSYRVAKDIPQLRTAENQRFPKKVVVKYMSTYADRANVNLQGRRLT